MNLIKWLNQNDHIQAYTYRNEREQVFCLRMSLGFVLITLVTCLLATVWYAKQPGVDLIPDNLPILGELEI